jgi:hypothetical protein
MDGDDDDQGHSINDDYRMADLPGDDESDLEADREELFGAVPPIPIDVDAEDVGPGDNPVADVVDDGVDAKKCAQRQSHSKPNKAGFTRAESK